MQNVNHKLDSLKQVYLKALSRRWALSNLLRVCSMAMVIVPFHIHAAETALKASGGVSYEYNDNITVDPENEVTLSGWVADGTLDARYTTELSEISGSVKVGVERYDDVDVDSDNPNLDEPDTSDYDNESLDLNTVLSYDWERHTLSVSGRYWRDSTLNTDFVESGLSGLRTIEGAKRRETLSVQPVWEWQLTERQRLGTFLRWQTVEYQSDRFVDYDYASATWNWSYALSERTWLQLQPFVSRFENDANVSVESDTVGAEAGLIWAISEKWSLDILAGASDISTEYGEDGFFFFDPVTGQLEFFEFEEQDDTSFSGSVSLTFDEEYYGLSTEVFSRYAPSGDGTLRQENQGRIRGYWKLAERMRIDADMMIGRSEDSGGALDRQRDYSQAGVRYSFQFDREWWISARYRYRAQEVDRLNRGEGKGHLFVASISYRLPEEIL